MKKNGKKFLGLGSIFVVIFVIWTVLIQLVDVQALGQNGTDIGFATFNCWFHKLTGESMTIYTITDILGIVPLSVCAVFALMGFIQLVKRRSLFKLDKDIIILGIYYIVVILDYVIFEKIPINYRPILIEGVMEVSYPSSTTLLVLCVMPTLIEQINRRIRNVVANRVIFISTILFSMYMVIGRLISGVHWFTDIVGSIFLSLGLFNIYKGFVLIYNKEK